MQKSLKTEQELKEKMRNIKQYFKRKKLPPEIGKKVANYLEYYYNEKETKKIDSVEIFELLNIKLSEELRIELNQTILNMYPMFSLEKYDPIIKILCRSVYEEIINPNEIIISEGEESCSRMYFIEKGNVILYHEATSVILKGLGPNNYFGEIGFLLRRPRSCSVITTTFCNIYFIIYNEFISIISNNNELARQVDDLIETDRRKALEQIYAKCYYCKEASHIVSDCGSFLKSGNIMFICKIFFI
jgi:hypothetical protein